MKGILIALLFVSGSAAACEPGEAVVFSCPSNTGPVEVCQAASTVKLRTAGKTISVPTAELLWQHDAGTGDETDDIHFPGAGEVYHVSIGRHRGEETPEAEVTLTKAQKITASLQCEAGKVKFDYTALKAERKGYD